MKATFLFLFLFLFLKTYAQETHQFYANTGFGWKNSFEVGLYHEYRLDFLVIQTGLHYKSPEEEIFINFKVGCAYRIKHWSFVAYAPYLNMIPAIGYNTPFCVETFFKDRLSLAVEIYRKDVIPIIKARIPLYGH